MHLLAKIVLYVSYLKNNFECGINTTAAIKGCLTPVLLVTDVQGWTEGIGAVAKPWFLRTTQRCLLTRDAACRSQSTEVLISP